MLKLENICKTYNLGTVNETTLFTNFNLEVKKGEFISVIGSNGSGKTSILNMICGSIPVDSGRILVQGQDITRMKEHQRSKFIGRVFQDPAKGTCPSMNILQNMAMADNKGKPFNLTAGINKKRIPYYQEQLSRLKLGLEDKLYVKVGALSGGQRQAMALLMSTMTPLDFLILDEHTAALDPKTSEIIMELTDEIVREKQLTTLMVTHNLRHAVEYGNRMIMMHQGGIVLDYDGEKKKSTQVDDILGIFNSISIECGN
ncbi:MAG: ATP-binding cassette domain-containing protein [Peptococcaceae bacterium]|nr:ATP-binding cassette domain-containing protein [Peptococcaceae bacterium]MBR3806976.1 ATP-binding cassette domain-containing protein [Lachnospiraceae bacterium]MBO5140174.1 ATP-binding cassette domain-containing protein [Peptococcaceae bacterium]MBO5301881.1 ATP-binding cassette domain-containing protein [Peptococcaceae bacterium]MBO5366298.1 ATP-binding cassette domain-containing protein [Peptococcaceae bacterium]